MASSNFIDYVKINVRSGDGGAGSRHFRREKFVDKGGPDGGDGGRGGHVIVRGNPQLWTLLHLKYTKHIRADGGNKGEGGRRAGAEGEDVYVEVPLGTVVKDAETGEQLLEITEPGEEIILLAGGRGGLGNTHFKSSTNQTPQHFQPGEPGVEQWVIMELKLLADVGLVGFPNAGKSTLLRSVSAAKPEVADYPFTTLVPNLGVVSYRGYQSFVMADIPGIIEGASQGKGLGIRFLRHIERNSLLLFMVPADAEDIESAYNTLLNELAQYNPELLDTPRLFVISKADLVSEEDRKSLTAKLPDHLKPLFISAVTTEGIEKMKDLIWENLNPSTTIE
jgi:GTP-binding protein